MFHFEQQHLWASVFFFCRKTTSAMLVQVKVDKIETVLFLVPWPIVWPKSLLLKPVGILAASNVHFNEKDGLLLKLQGLLLLNTTPNNFNLNRFFNPLSINIMLASFFKREPLGLDGLFWNELEHCMYVFILNYILISANIFFFVILVWHLTSGQYLQHCLNF